MLSFQVISVCMPHCCPLIIQHCKIVEKGHGGPRPLFGESTKLLGRQNPPLHLPPTLSQVHVGFVSAPLALSVSAPLALSAKPAAPRREARDGHGWSLLEKSNLPLRHGRWMARVLVALVHHLDVHLK